MTYWILKRWRYPLERTHPYQKVSYLGKSRCGTIWQVTRCRAIPFRRKDVALAIAKLWHGVTVYRVTKRTVKRKRTKT